MVRYDHLTQEKAAHMVSASDAVICDNNSGC